MSILFYYFMLSFIPIAAHAVVSGNFNHLLAAVLVLSTRCPRCGASCVAPLCIAWRLSSNHLGHTRRHFLSGVSMALFFGEELLLYPAHTANDVAARGISHLRCSNMRRHRAPVGMAMSHAIASEKHPRPGISCIASSWRCQASSTPATGAWLPQCEHYKDSSHILHVSLILSVAMCQYPLMESPHEKLGQARSPQNPSVANHLGQTLLSHNCEQEQNRN